MFEIKQVALEHLSSAKVMPVTIEVIAPTPDPEPEIETVTVPDFFVAGNSAPFYELPPTASVAVNRTAEVSSWSLSLPEPTDFDKNDTISVSVNLGLARLFVEYDEVTSEFRINDLSSDAVFEGNFTLTVTLDDGTDQSSYSITLEVFPLEFTPEEIQKEWITTEAPSNLTESL